jgi:hypothetical protein
VGGALVAAGIVIYAAAHHRAHATRVGHGPDRRLATTRPGRLE